ncbi:MAG: putative toxin-antitoxin system toxin component, PIN family [Candidatus Woesearchaeota archaeon]
MKVVIDTNVFISGIFWTGSPNKVITAWKAGKFQTIVSIDIVNEISRVLSDFEIALPPEQISEWTDLIMKNSIIVEPQDKVMIVKEDPADNKFVDAAVSGKAELIVTGDAHLKKLKEYQGVKIISPDEFLQMLK